MGRPLDPKGIDGRVSMPIGAAGLAVREISTRLTAKDVDLARDCLKVSGVDAGPCPTGVVEL